MKPTSYTKVARPTLWLLRPDTVTLASGVEVDVGAIYVGKTVITNAHYREFRPDHEPPPGAGPDHPAVNVTFDDAQAYCAWYAELTGRAFRLPTEAEWLRTAADGATTRHFAGDAPEALLPWAWARENSNGVLPPVEQTRANPAGVHDMLGSVWEWTTSLETGSPVLRGGSYQTPVAEMTCDISRPAARDECADDIGFRIVRSL